MNTSKMDALALVAASSAELKTHLPPTHSFGVIPFAVHPSASGNDISGTRKDPANRHKPSFVDKLYAMLSDKRAKSIITWLPSGKSFIILDKDKFIHQILPKYLRAWIQFDSFARRLKRWGFRKVYTTGMAHGVYSHYLFQRDRPDLIKEMNCRADRDPASKATFADTSKLDTAVEDQVNLAKMVVQANRDMVVTKEELEKFEVPQPAATANRLIYAVPIQAAANQATVNYIPAGTVQPSMPVKPAAMVNYVPAQADPANYMLAPMMNHPIQPNHANPMMMMNFTPQANVPVAFNNGYMPRAISSFPRNEMTDAHLMRRAKAIEEEIKMCEEHLAILQRLRTLRERSNGDW